MDDPHASEHRPTRCSTSLFKHFTIKIRHVPDSEPVTYLGSPWHAANLDRWRVIFAMNMTNCKLVGKSWWLWFRRLAQGRSESWRSRVSRIFRNEVPMSAGIGNVWNRIGIFPNRQARMRDCCNIDTSTRPMQSGIIPDSRIRSESN